MNNKSAKSYIMIIVSMLMFGTIGIFRRYIPLSSGLLAFLRGILGSLFLFLLVVVKKHKLQKIDKKTLSLLCITGALIGLNWIFLFEAYNLTSVANATMAYYMQPTIVIMLSPMLLKEKLTIKKVICAFTAIVGMMFISGIFDMSNTSEGNIKGIISGLIAALLYASVVIINKKVNVEDAYEKTIIQLSAAAVILIPYIIFTEDFSKVNLDKIAIIMVLIVGIFHTGIAYALYFGSMSNLKSQSIAVLSYIDPVFALILSATFLHENMTVFGVVGAILIIGSAFVSEMNFDK